MPEGDTIFRAARTLHAALAGRVVTRFETAYAQLASVDDQSPIAGRTIEDVSAAGKHCLMRLSGDLVLRTHMRMNGSWHLYRPGERWRKPRGEMRILVETDAFVAVAFNVPVAAFETSRSLARVADLAKLGPDLLAPTFDEDDAVSRFQGRRGTTMGEALLNQRVVAGAGNVFKSEVLFLCGVNPYADAGRVPREKLVEIVRTARKLLQANVRDGKGEGIVTYTGFRRTTRRADPSERLWVYGRGGEPCRKCATPIVRAKQGLDARSTYWCPRCQPVPSTTPDALVSG